MSAELPLNLEAEQGLLACLLLNPSLIPATAFRLANFDEPFKDGRNANIFAALEEIEAGGISDPAKIQWELVQLSKTRALGGAPYVAGLMNAAPSDSLWDEYCTALIDVSRRRRQIEGATMLEKAARAGNAEAISEAEQILAEAKSPTPRDSLPEIVSAASALANPQPKPPELVYGLLHRGSKLVLGGCSKSFKTWTLIDLAIAVSAGEPFWSMKTAKGRVLYLNLEVQPAFFDDRIKAVASAKFVRDELTGLDLWHLRGHAADYRTLLPKITARIRQQGYALLILDPVYKLLGGADENSATEMAEMMNALEGVARETGSAIAFGAHFAKGNAANKDSIDRISGSGVFARDPDTILTLTKHETDDAFVVDATLRNFKPMPPFCVQWLFPLMRRDDELDPTKLKKAGGRKAEHAPGDIIELIKGGPLSTSEWQQLAEKESGIKERTFYRLHKGLKQAGTIEQKEGKWHLLP